MRSALLLAALLSGTGMAQTCAPTVQARAAATLALESRLRAVVVEDDVVTDIPAALRPLLHDFKQGLIETVETGLRCGNPAPDRIESDLAKLLQANRPEPVLQHGADAMPRSEVYGAGLAVSVAAVAGQPDLFTIRLGYGLPCGGDNMLLVYRRTPQGYRRVLLWQNPDLNSLSDALGDVFYFAPVPAPVPAFVVLHGHPWCTSRLSSFNVDLVALGTPSSAQRVLDHVEVGYRREGDEKFVPEPDGFEFKSSVESGDTEIVVRPSVMRFATGTGKLVRLPVETSARAFVDAWLTADWRAVAGWGDPPNQAHLHKLHDEMTGPDRDFYSFGPTLACGGQHYQVELTSEADHTTPDLQIINLPSRFAQVRTNANSFTLLDIADKADPTCKGPDLMGKRK